MPQTKVALKHLLDDIRESYPCPVEEAILTELIANSLDSHCSRIEITIEQKENRFTFVDDGQGMTRKDFEQYHDIAATAKERGKGIGFAGLGAKLALLLCREVVSETVRDSCQLCSRWRLESDSYAPWDWMEPPGLVGTRSGTGVRLMFSPGQGALLLNPEYVSSSIRQHFYPLLDPQFEQVIRVLYPNGVVITVNARPVTLPAVDRESTQIFVVQLGRKRSAEGIGFISRSRADLPEIHRGLAISTYGKVIKRGWDWIGLTPKNVNRVSGLVEMPALVGYLTTNKCDFLRDPNSLQKYYKVRKAIQDAVAEVLEKLGETRAAEPKPDKSMEKLRKEIDKVLSEILPDFPELEPLFGRKKSGEKVPVHVSEPGGQVQSTEAPGTDVTAGGFGGEGAGEGVEGDAEGPMDGTHQEPDDAGPEQAEEHVKRRKRPGLMIGFDDETGGDDIGWLRSSTLYVNALHPAYERVQESSEADLYVTFAVASTLSAHVQEERPPLEFVQRFLAAWGAMR